MARPGNRESRATCLLGPQPDNLSNMAMPKPSARAKRYTSADHDRTPRHHPVARQTLAAATVEAIRDRILSGAYAEGEQLRQDALAADLGVSRIPVREALRQLEAEGLVTF